MRFTSHQFDKAVQFCGVTDNLNGIDIGRDIHNLGTEDIRTALHFFGLLPVARTLINMSSRSICTIGQRGYFNDFNQFVQLFGHLAQSYFWSVSVVKVKRDKVGSSVGATFNVSML